MVYDKLPIDISRLKFYFPEFEQIYNNNKPVNNEPLIYNAEIALDISEQEKEAFEQRYLQLLTKFNIPTTDYALTDILYICQKVIHELQLIETLRDLDPQTLNALDFLIGYQELVQEVNKNKSLNKHNYKSNDEDAIIIQVKDKHSNGAIPLHYDGSGRLIVKMIYKAFKTTFYNTTLSHVLENYDEIPPLEVLRELKTPNATKDSTLTKEMLSATAEILSEYFDKYLPKGILSRKKNLFIFELFYLFNTLHYAGKVMKTESETLLRAHLNPEYSLPLKSDKRSIFITELIKNSNRRDKPLSGAFLSFT